MVTCGAPCASLTLEVVEQRLECDHGILLRRYVPNSRLQYEYPDNYDAAVQQSCLDDSNVLDGPDREGEHYLAGGQDRGDEDAQAQCSRDYH